MVEMVIKSFSKGIKRFEKIDGGNVVEDDVECELMNRRGGCVGLLVVLLVIWMRRG